MSVPIEVHLWRNMLPRSRIAVVLLDYDTPHNRTGIKLPPASIAAHGEMWAEFRDATLVAADWLAFRAQIMIDMLPLSSPRPGVVWLGHSDIVSGIVQFPRMAADDNLSLGGWHSLRLRRV